MNRFENQDGTIDRSAVRSFCQRDPDFYEPDETDKECCKCGDPVDPISFTGLILPTPDGGAYTLRTDEYPGCLDCRTEAAVKILRFGGPQQKSLSEFGGDRGE